MRDDKVYLTHIRDAVNRISQYTTEGKDCFFQDIKTQDAVIRNLEIIGEAVKNISSKLKTNYPATPWSTIGRLRDKLIHHYFGVDMIIIWDIIGNDLKLLDVSVENILNHLESKEQS